MPAYPLRVTVRGQGQVSSEPAGLACGPGSTGTCRGVFSDVTLRAEPAAGSHSVCATTLSRPSTLPAEFVPVPRHEVKLAVTGPGAVQGLVDGVPCTKGARACGALVMQGGGGDPDGGAGGGAFLYWLEWGVCREGGDL